MDWFDATEDYPRQLHEMERGAYLDMKRKELSRQKADNQKTENRKTDNPDTAQYD